MSLPFGNLDTTFESFLQELPEDYRELAIQFKAFCRSRKIKTPEQLMQVVMGYCGIDEVLRETAGNFTLLEERISDTAIHKRLKACVPWVKALLSRMMGDAAKPLIEGHLRFLIVDGSTVQGPGAKGTEYRLHIAMDLVRLHLVHVKVTDEHEGEHLGHYPLQNGDVVVMDRGYNRAQMWIDQADQGVSLVVRYNPHGLNLYDSEGQKINVEEVLGKTSAMGQCLPVQVRSQKKEWVQGHLHARRLPPAQAAQARRRARAAARKKGRTIQPRTLALAEWVLIFTTLVPEVLPTDTVMALYRVRWQVELVIKRLKSILNMDHLRARKASLLADLYLHGKLLYAWVIEKRLRRRCGDDWNRLDQPRRATPWRVLKLLERELASALHETGQWNLNRWPEAMQVIQERRRRRTLQTVPERVSRLIASCQAQGLSNI
jgi:Transposase DDE domain